MKILFAILIVIAALGILFQFLRSRTRNAQSGYVTIDQLPTIVDELKRTGNDGSFVVFMFSPAGPQDEILPNLQYSIEGGSLGLDWVLMAPRNLRDEIAFNDFIERLGYLVSKREMNGVRYLRIEGPGIIDLGGRFLRDFYQLDHDAKLELITDGFDWQP